MPPCLEPLARCADKEDALGDVLAMIHVLWPLMRYVSTSRTARRRAPDVRAGAGSLIAIAMTSPPAIAREHVLLLRVGAEALVGAGDDEADAHARHRHRPFVVSSSRRQRSTTSPPAPPYSSGIAAPT